jgi:hypothetical protein
VSKKKKYEFSKSKNKIEKFFETNVDMMMQNTKVMLEVEEKNRIRRINKQNQPELK